MSEETVQVGDVWRDLDPRSPNEVAVLGFDPTNTRVLIQRPSRRVWVARRRFFKRFAFVFRAGHSSGGAA